MRGRGGKVRTLPTPRGYPGRGSDPSRARFYPSRDLEGAILALGSLPSFRPRPNLRRLESLTHRNLLQGVLRAAPGDGAAVAVHTPVVTHRSEERRVGTEWRSRGGP